MFIRRFISDKYAKLEKSLNTQLNEMVGSKVETQHTPKQTTIDVDILQQNVIGLLDEINLLIDSTQTDIDNLTESKYEQIQSQITAAGQNVAKLHLRMAIVAPMKAGKSTIINAIAGQELLPSCAVAMTTIPTEIVFDREATKPTLHLSEATLNLFSSLENKLKQEVERVGIEPLQERLDRYPHLIDLFAKIAKSQEFTLNPEIVGCQEISSTLNRLNHVVRLSSVIDPSVDPLGTLRDIPKIHTPWLNISRNQQASTSGSLTIVDTPGPNEAGEGLRLTAVVEEQLSRCSIVLVVLDFTQLNSEAAESIKQQIQPVIDSIGKDNLYILVNKIDQRRQGDMTPEQVKDFVIADLGLSNGDGSRIFEVAAVRAFAATRFLLEVQQNPKIQLLQIKSLTALAQEVLGIDWDEELEDITVKIMLQKALKLWKKSGFAPFIVKAIAELMKNAAPQCMSNALSLSRNHLVAIQDDLNLRNNAISQDTAKIQQEIESLEKDLSYLEACRDRLSSMTEIKLKLQTSLQNILEKLKSEAAVDVENIFAGEEYEQADALKKADIKARNLLTSNLGDFELFPRWVSENIKAGIEYRTSGTVSFKTELEAEYFTQEAIGKAREHLEELILKVSEDIELEVKQAREDIEKFLIEETQDIIERAKNRLQTNFDIELQLPSPIITSNREIQIEKQLVKTKSRLVDDGYDELLVKRRAWYYWLGAIPFYSQEKRKRPYKKEDYYAVSIPEVVEQINISSDRFIDEINGKVIVYIEQELHQQVDNFFIKLDNYLGNYLQSLQQAQSDRQLSLERRDKLANSLGRLVPQTTNCINKADSYLEQTQQMIVYK